MKSSKFIDPTTRKKFSGVTKLDKDDFREIDESEVTLDRHIINSPPPSSESIKTNEVMRFPGMRETGSVKKTENYTLAEYEYKDYRLEGLANDLSHVFKEHFVLYDYKGSIKTNNNEVLTYLSKLYSDGYEVGGDLLHISNNILELSNDINAVKKDKIDNTSKEFDAETKKHSVLVSKNISFNNARPSFGVNSFANTLSNIIINVPEQSGMMIGIFGKWGRGKTYLVDKIWEKLKVETKFKRVNFSAWKYQDTKESWAYLYETIMTQYLTENIKEGRFYRNFKYYKLWKLNLQKHKYLPIFTFLVAFIGAAYWTFGVDKLELIRALISLLGLSFLFKAVLFYFSQKQSAMGLLNNYFNKKNYNEYLGMQAEIESEIENIVKTWIPTPNKSEKVFLFVDDIDRCPLEKILDIIDGLRVILDNPEIHKRLVIVTAIDEEILQKSVELKYGQIEIGAKTELFKQYLEKIFIIGIKLNALKPNEIQEFLTKLVTVTPKEANNNKGKKSSTTSAKFETEIPREEKVDNSQPKTTDKERAPTQTEDELSKDDLALTNEERDYLINSISQLENATPRKIRIYYYKYLISKQLFHNYINERELQSQWSIYIDEKIIMDALLKTSNDINSNFYNNINMDKELKEGLREIVTMVSIL